MSENQEAVKKARKPKAVESVETVNPAIEVVSRTNVEVAQDEMLELIRSLQKEISELKSGKSEETVHSNGQNRYVDVISLHDGPLFLSTGERGEGKKYGFKGFGNMHRILSHDLDDVIRNYNTWATEGYYYIKDKKFIEESGLIDAYEHILSKEELNKLVDGGYGDATSDMFKKASYYQKGLIYRLAVQRVASGKYDSTTIDKIEKLANAYVRYLNKAHITKENPLPETMNVDIVGKGRIDGKYDNNGNVKVVEEDFD